MKKSQVDINNTVLILRKNIQSMVAILNTLHEKNKVLESQLDVLKNQNKQLRNESEKLQNVAFSKKLEDSLPGSSEQRNEIRQQLDFLVKEIDKCIEDFN